MDLQRLDGLMGKPSLECKLIEEELCKIALASVMVSQSKERNLKTINSIQSTNGHLSFITSSQFVSTLSNLISTACPTLSTNSMTEISPLSKTP